jgi:uncharacterized membrane protein (DUF4010 family)
VLDEQQTFYHLGVALAIGLLIGVERGWKEREAGEGDRVAGLRTFGLIGLLGGGSALIAGEYGVLVLGFTFVALAGVLTSAYVANLGRRADNAGVTSLIAALLTFVLGALAMLQDVVPAVAAAVVTTLLLDVKPILHRWVSAIEGNELRAGLKLLLISVVMLPVLPNRGYGPWQALNPYEIWWMVVLIAAISFAGYLAVKLAGAHRGALFTGLFAGLASSTALTLHFARVAAREPRMAPTLATGILLACGTMFPRMMIIAVLINWSLLRASLLPIAAMTFVVYAAALWFMRTASRELETRAPMENPLELRVAVTFGVVLAVVLLMTKALESWLGHAGLMLLAAVSGIADVDAITLSLARASRGGDLTVVAVTGLVIGAAVNSLVKAGMAAVIGGRALGSRVMLPLAAASAAGGLITWLTLW